MGPRDLLSAGARSSPGPVRLIGRSSGGRPSLSVSRLYSRAGRLDIGQILGTQRNGAGAGGLRDMADRARPDNRGGDPGLVDDPGQGELRQTEPTPLGDGPQGVNYAQMALEAVWGEDLLVERDRHRH